MKWILLFVYIFKGEVVTDVFEFRYLTQCATSSEALISDAADINAPVLVVECIPKSESWNLNDY